MSKIRVKEPVPIERRSNNYSRLRVHLKNLCLNSLSKRFQYSKKKEACTRSRALWTWTATRNLKYSSNVKEMVQTDKKVLLNIFFLFIYFFFEIKKFGKFDFYIYFNILKFVKKTFAWTITNLNFLKIYRMKSWHRDMNFTHKMT